MNATRKNFPWVGLGIALIAAACGVVGAAWCIVGPVIPAGTLRELRGTPREDVRRILGDPAEIQSDQSWIYDRPPTQGWVVIHFDERGRVDAVNDEQACPGLWGPAGSWSEVSPAE